MVWLCELPYKPVFVHASSENLSLYRAGGFCLFCQDCIPENNGVAKVPVKGCRTTTNPVPPTAQACYVEAMSGCVL